MQVLPPNLRKQLLAALMNNVGHGTYDPMFGPNMGRDRDNEPFDGPNAGEHIIGERDDTSHAPGSSMPEDYMRRLYPGNSRTNMTGAKGKNLILPGTSSTGGANNILLNLLTQRFGAK